MAKNYNSSRSSSSSNLLWYSAIGLGILYFMSPTKSNDPLHKPIDDPNTVQQEGIDDSGNAISYTHGKGNLGTTKIMKKFENFGKGKFTKASLVELDELNSQYVNFEMCK